MVQAIILIIIVIMRNVRNQFNIYSLGKQSGTFCIFLFLKCQIWVTLLCHLAILSDITLSPCNLEWHYFVTLQYWVTSLCHLVILSDITLSPIVAYFTSKEDKSKFIFFVLFKCSLIKEVLNINDEHIWF